LSQFLPGLILSNPAPPRAVGYIIDMDIFSRVVPGCYRELLGPACCREEDIPGRAVSRSFRFFLLRDYTVQFHIIFVTAETCTLDWSFYHDGDHRISPTRITQAYFRRVWNRFTKASACIFVMGLPRLDCFCLRCPSSAFSHSNSPQMDLPFLVMDE